ncbi:hypothetical protein KUTeg_002150 [Tegillarca granosa]|uniref:Uncharacterized protein n=1 Tax=Tegillarca granosa TaxID=220873 RepID=A0ABQ9FXY8_TEGGR|nr:hypothetical protein KUTeg_002150 [Tegillarca granosa]
MAGNLGMGKRREVLKNSMENKRKKRKNPQDIAKYWCGEENDPPRLEDPDPTRLKGQLEDKCDTGQLVSLQNDKTVVDDQGFPIIPENDRSHGVCKEQGDSGFKDVHVQDLEEDSHPNVFKGQLGDKCDTSPILLLQNDKGMTVDPDIVGMPENDTSLGLLRTQDIIFKHSIEEGLDHTRLKGQLEDKCDTGQLVSLQNDKTVVNDQGFPIIPENDRSHGVCKEQGDSGFKDVHVQDLEEDSHPNVFKGQLEDKCDTRPILPLQNDKGMTVDPGIVGMPENDTSLGLLRTQDIIFKHSIEEGLDHTRLQGQLEDKFDTGQLISLQSDKTVVNDQGFPMIPENDRSNGVCKEQGDSGFKDVHVQDLEGPYGLYGQDGLDGLPSVFGQSQMPGLSSDSLSGEPSVIGERRYLGIPNNKGEPCIEGDFVKDEYPGLTRFKGEQDVLFEGPLDLTSAYMCVDDDLVEDFDEDFDDEVKDKDFNPKDYDDGSSEYVSETDEEVIVPIVTKSKQIMKRKSSDGNNSKEDKTVLDYKAQRKQYFKNITVATYEKNGTKRNYSNPDYCLYCNNVYTSKIANHYINVHINEQRVQDICRMPLRSYERKTALKKLQYEGNYIHNLQVLKKGMGELIVIRRPSFESKTTVSALDYIPCEFCKGFVKEEALWMHVKNCAFRPAVMEAEKNYVRNGRMMIEPFITTVTSDFEIVLNKMKETTQCPGVKEICSGDHLIKQFGQALYDKLGTVSEQRISDPDNIRTKMRAVGRLLSKMNENKPQPLPLSSYITGKGFLTVVNSVKELSIEADAPSLAIRLGNYLKQIALIKNSLGIMSEDDLMKKEASDFKDLFDAHWNSKVSSVANRRQKLRSLNKKIEIPSTSDLMKLKDFLISNINECLKNTKPTYDEWVWMAQLLIVRIVLFNKRRINEVAELKISDYEERVSDTNFEISEVLDSLDVSERALAKRMHLLEVRGKSTRGLRKMFILLSPEMIAGIDYLLNSRIYVGVNPSNKYVFGRTTLNPIDGCTAMRDVTDKCPSLEKPKTIRSRLLRKYLATVSQVMDMTGDELKMVADHMGHSLSIHTDIYKLQNSTLERTKVARALVALENGNVHKYKGKNLSSIDLKDMPLPLESDEDDFEKKDNTNEIESAIHSDEEEFDEIYSLGVKRKRWSEEEDNAFAEAFSVQIKEKRNASAQEIRQAQNRFKQLESRTEAVIRTKLNNMILGKYKKMKCQIRKSCN